MPTTQESPQITDATEKHRKGYWWECEQCHHYCDFEQGCGKSILKFLWELKESAWDQAQLARRCPKCKQSTFRITYDFPRKEEPERLSVQHIVGLDYRSWLPMLWETTAQSDPDANWFDIKYVGRTGIWGLNKPAVLTQSGLRELFSVYSKLVSHKPFP